MNHITSRRHFLKGAAVLGTGLYIFPAFAAADKHDAVALVLSSDAIDTGFAEGVAQISTIQAHRIPVFQPDQWLQLIQEYAGQRLIGLMGQCQLCHF